MLLSEISKNKNSRTVENQAKNYIFLVLGLLISLPSSSNRISERPDSSPLMSGESVQLSLQINVLIYIIMIVISQTRLDPRVSPEDETMAPSCLIAPRATSVR